MKIGRPAPGDAQVGSAAESADACQVAVVASNARTRPMTTCRVNPVGRHNASICASPAAMAATLLRGARSAQTSAEGGPFLHARTGFLESHRDGPDGQTPA